MGLMCWRGVGFLAMVAADSSDCALTLWLLPSSRVVMLALQHWGLKHQGPRAVREFARAVREFAGRSQYVHERLLEQYGRELCLFVIITSLSIAGVLNALT